MLRAPTAMAHVLCSSHAARLVIVFIGRACPTCGLSLMVCRKGPALRDLAVCLRGMEVVKGQHLAKAFVEGDAALLEKSGRAIP